MTVERFLSLLSTFALVGCFVTGFLALRHFAEADDLTGLLLSTIALIMGLISRRLIGVRSEQG